MFLVIFWLLEEPFILERQFETQTGCYLAARHTSYEYGVPARCIEVK